MKYWKFFEAIDESQILKLIAEYNGIEFKKGKINIYFKTKQFDL